MIQGLRKKNTVHFDLHFAHLLPHGPFFINNEVIRNKTNYSEAVLYLKNNQHRNLSSINNYDQQIKVPYNSSTYRIMCIPINI